MNRGLFSKFAFGFLMAQLFPGAVGVLAIFLAVKTFGTESIGLADQVDYLWGELEKSPALIAVYLFLAIGTGMLIHGLNWTVLAWLENHKDPDNPKPVHESFWHGRLLVFQLLVGPIKMVAELVWLLFARGVRPLILEENVPKIKPERMPNFIFVQDFYLHFSQFYAHTAYALLLSTICLSLGICHLGFTPQRFLWLLISYLATSVFFLMGRVQLMTLFAAERGIRSTNFCRSGLRKYRPTRRG